MLAYERIGSGEPLVLLHGVSHRRQAWYPVVEELARHRELILVDLPGHGESPKLVTGGKAPGEAVVHELLGFFAELGLDRPHVAGNSIGGLFALHLAEAGAARSVTTLSPAGFWHSWIDYLYTLILFGTVMVAGTILSPFAKPLTRTRAGRALLFFWIHRNPGRVDPDLALGDYKALLRARLTLLRFATGGKPYRPEIPASVPVTVAWAHWDMVLPRYQAGNARRRLPGATHLALPGCGHVPMVDDPALVARVVLEGSARPHPRTHAA